MSFAWSDDEAWCLVNRSLTGFASPYVGNGTIGTRTGLFVLGTDPRAPSWSTCRDLPQRPEMPPGDPHGPLPTFSSFVRDGFQYALPTWNQLKMTIGGIPFTPVDGKHLFQQTLDLRTGEASLIDDWIYAPGRNARILIRLLIPRTHPHASLWELEVSQASDEVRVEFGLLAQHLGGDLPMRYELHDHLVIGAARTLPHARPVVEGLSWSTTGEFISSRVEEADVHLCVARHGNLRLSVFHAVHGGLEPAEGAVDRVRRDLADIEHAWTGDLRSQNEAIWKKLWASALSVSDLNPADARLVLAQQYYLLASLDRFPYPMAALGLSGNNWQGNALWDADRWVGAAVLGLWPDLARRFPEFRLTALPAAQRFAAGHGYAGAWFSWMHDEAGNDMTPPAYLAEIHNNIWIVHMAWELWLETREPQLLQEQVWPLLSNIAAFFVSRCEQDPDGSWHLRNVMGPDEAVHEAHHATSDDNFLTNVGVRWLMRTACEVAGLLGRPVAPAWPVLANSLTLLPPNADGVIPEHAAYCGQGIKQADTIMAFFPLDWPAPPDIVRKTLSFYHDKILAYGPLMTTQVEATILMRLGNPKDELTRLFACYREYVRGPFLVPFECRNNDTAVMLTGIGGLLQALMVGWHGWRAGSGRHLPRIGDGWPL